MEDPLLPARRPDLGVQGLSVQTVTMTEGSPTIGDLVKAKAITPDEIDAAVEALLKGRMEALFRFADGWSLDLTGAVDGHPVAKRALEDSAGTVGYRRTMVRTAILLARPAKA